MAEISSTPPLTFPAGDVVKQGYLFVKRPPRKYLSKIKAWHRRYFVLRDQTQEHCPLLEMYERNELMMAPLGLTGPKLILDLGQCVHIGFTSDSSRFPYALVVVCQGRSPLLLAAEDELGARSWLLALGLITHKGSGHSSRTFIKPPIEGASLVNRTSSLRESSAPHDTSVSMSVESSAGSVLPEEYTECGVDISFAREIFPVIVHPTETSERLGFSGDMQLVVFSHGVGLAKTNKTECFVIWPVAYIRQYQHESIASGGRSKFTIVTLEVGRRSSTGEGVFQFRTQKGQEIIRELKTIVELWSARKAVVAIQQSKVDNRTASQRWQWNASGRSAPCTPSLAFPHSWQNRRSSPGPNKRPTNSLKNCDKDDPDLNYVLPVFDRSLEYAVNDSGTSSPNLSSSRSLRNSPAHTVTAAVGKDGCVKTTGSRIVRRTSESEMNSDECCYVEIVSQGPNKDLSLVSTDSVLSTETSKKDTKGDKSPAVVQEAEAYIEVLPT